MAKFINDNNRALVKEMIDKGYLNIQKHPTADLWLYNYSRSCQIDKVWNEVTCMCRGLIVDKDNNIVARPFVKFFNYEEITDKSIIPDLPCEAYEKLDGSLGIMYWVDNVPYICTRGSFTSPQGLHATEILHNNYSEHFNKLDRAKTYLFEIIWNEDHHCISYGDLDDIFLLAVFDTDSAAEDDIYNWESIFKCTKRYDGVSDYLKIRDMFSGDNREGFVIKFSNGFRMKLKYEQYFKIHFLRSSLTEKNILNMLITGNMGNIPYNSIEELLKELDEENQIYYNNIVNKYNTIYKDIENYCKNWFANTTGLSEREIIENIKLDKYSGILFKMLRNMDYTETIWNYIRKYCI